MNSYFLNNFYSRLIILSTIFCIILSLVIPELILNILAFSGILTFGIIHGANDLFLINKVSTKKNLKAKAAKGSLLSIIGFVVIKAEDQRSIKISGKILTISGFIEHLFLL